MNIKECIERGYLKKEKPDFLVGYFSDGFDMPYLRARAEKHKIKLNISLDNSVPSIVRGRIPASKLTGISHIDLFRFIDTVYSQYLQSETLGLNEVASELIGEKKHELSEEIFRSSGSLKEEDWLRYFRYNLQDSVLTEKLFHKLWPDIMEFTKITQEPSFDIARDGFSQLVENYIIHNLNRFNEIALNKPNNSEIEERRGRKKYEGAFVLQPEPSLYENLAV